MVSPDKKIKSKPIANTAKAKITFESHTLHFKIIIKPCILIFYKALFLPFVYIKETKDQSEKLGGIFFKHKY